MKNPKLNWFKEKQVKLHKPLIILSLLQLVMSLTAIFFAFFSREVVDTALISTQSSTFLIYATVLGLLLLIQLVTSTVTPYIKTLYTVKLENQLKEKLFTKLLNTKQRELESYHTGDLLNHLTSDIHVIADGAIDIVPRMLFFIVRFLGAFILLYFIDPFLALIIIGFGILLFLGSRLLAKPIKTRHKRLQNSESKVRAMIQESLSHVPVIKSFEAEDKMEERLKGLNTQYLHASLSKQRFSMLTSFGMTGFLAFGYGLAIILGAVRLSTGALTIGGLTALIQLVGHLQSPFGGMSQLIPKYYQLQASLERIQVLERLEMDESNRVTFDSFDEIKIDHLSFSYQDDPVINDLNFSIKKKHIIQIMGESGKGKTTLIKLLLGLYQPTKGNIQIISQNQHYPLSSNTRSLFTYVPQGHMMMSGTIKENLRFYQHASEDKLWDVLKIVNLDEDFKNLPLQLDTQLGEKGLGLSEGQIQRLALARALIKDAPIILLDEVTSALDQKAEEHVLSNLKKMTDKTVIMISHRNLPSSFIDQYLYL